MNRRMVIVGGVGLSGALIACGTEATPPQPTAIPTRAAPTATRVPPTPTPQRTVAGPQLRWTLAKLEQADMLVDKDNRLRSDETETWMVVQVLARNTADSSQHLHENNMKLRFTVPGEAESIEKRPDSKATGVASRQFNVGYIGGLIGTSLRLDEEKRYLMAFRVRRAMESMELWLQGAAEPLDIKPFWK